MDWPFIYLLHCALWACLSILPGHAYRSSASGQLGVPGGVGGPRALPGCLFPERWEGTWFQSGVRQPIIIEGSRLSNKGTCLGSEGDKFVVVDDKRVCYRCVVIHEKHANVLQYKETYCHGRDSLPTICSLITGDALLYSMFREGALPVPCPFRGPFTFTYNRGHGECKNPVSTIDACTEDSRLLLSYQACPDVYGTESTVEELQCLATWKEGSSRYLVGKVHHSHATSNEDRFRCFVYEKIGGINEGREGSSLSRLGGTMGGLTSSSHRERLIAGENGRQTLDLDVDYKVAQSGDATCNGLFSASEGSRTMTLRKAPLQSKCRFPQFLSISQHWHTLDYGATWSFHHRNSTLRISNATSGQEMKVVCSQHQNPPHQLKHLGSNVEMIVAHFTMGCQNGEMCMLFYRRDTHVVEIQMGAHVRRPEDACAPQHFDRATSKFITLVTTSPEPRACPFPGKFQITSVSPIDHRARRSLHHRDHSHYRHQEPGNTPLTSGNVFKNRIKRIDKPGNQCSTGWTYEKLTIGCSGADTMEFGLTCNGGDRISAYSCHGSWEENSTLYVITTPLSRASHGARRHCFMYRRTSVHLPSSYESSTSNSNKRNGNSNKNVPQEVDRTPPPLILQLASSTEGCDRNFREDEEGVVIFNSTQTGACIETNNKDRPELSLSLILIIMLPALINYVLLQDNR